MKQYSTAHRVWCWVNKTKHFTIFNRSRHTWRECFFGVNSGLCRGSMCLCVTDVTEYLLIASLMSEFIFEHMQKMDTPAFAAAAAVVSSCELQTVISYTQYKSYPWLLCLCSIFRSKWFISHFRAVYFSPISPLFLRIHWEMAKCHATLFTFYLFLWRAALFWVTFSFSVNNLRNRCVFLSVHTFSSGKKSLPQSDSYKMNFNEVR